MKYPEITSSFTYRDKIIQVEWYDLVHLPIPSLPWQQVYVIGDLDGLVPIVHYETGDRDNLPGGKTEEGETVEQTVSREVAEEINCGVLSWEPLGYQKLTEPDGKIIYQLRVFARLQDLGGFTGDKGGAVTDYSLVELDSVNDRIGYGEVGDRMVQLTKSLK